MASHVFDTIIIAGGLVKGLTYRQLVAGANITLTPAAGTPNTLTIAAGAGTPTTITVTDTTDSTCFVALFESATGDLAPKTDAGLTYNAATGMLTATGFTGPLTGNADTVTTNANLTGPITSVGNATSIASQTGTGTTFAMSVSPTFTGTPAAPTAAPGTNTTQIATTAFVTAAVTAGVATTITVADTTDSTCFVALFESATGDLAPKTDGGLLYNAATGLLTATAIQTTGNLTVDGDLLVSGTTTTFNTATITVEDPLIKLASGNTADVVDIGFYGRYNQGAANLYSGIFRDATDSKFHLFDGLQDEPTTTVNTSGLGYTPGILVANVEGNATTASTATIAESIEVDDASGDTTCWILMAGSQTGNLAALTDGGLTYNATINALTTTTFIGALTGNASTATALQNARTIGGTSFDGTANIVPATIVVVATSNTACSVALFEAASGNLAPRTDSTLTFNASTNVLSATTFSGNLSGTIVVADTNDSTCFVGLWESATGNLAPKTDAGLTYDATTGALTATSFVGTTSASTLTGTFSDAVTSNLSQNNVLINGGFDIFQRADTVKTMTDDAYNAPDRWYSLIEGTGPTIQRVTGTDQCRFSCKIVAGGTTNRGGIAQIIESINVFPLRSQECRFQCRVRPNRNAGAGTIDIRCAILEYTGAAPDNPTSEIVNDWTSGTYTEGNFFTTSASHAVLATASVTATHNTWTDLATTFTIGSSASNLIVFIWWEDVPVHASDFIEITKCALVEGTEARKWRPRPIADELAICQRYFEKSYAIATAPGTSTTTGRFMQIGAATTDVIGFTVPHIATKRATPTITLYDTAGNSGKITEITAGGGATTNVTPSIGAGDICDRGFTVIHDPSSSILGMAFHYTSESEL